MRELHRVKEDSTFSKDVSSGAVIRTDLEAFQARKAKKQEAKRLLENDKRIAALEERVALLEKFIMEGLHNGH